MNKRIQYGSTCFSVIILVSSFASSFAIVVCIGILNIMTKIEDGRWRGGGNVSMPGEILCSILPVFMFEVQIPPRST